MSGEIKVNPEGLAQDAAQLRSAIADFESYASGFFGELIDRIAPFNSDFISRISRMLNNMRDNRTPALQAKLGEYVQGIETAKATFAEGDTTIAGHFTP